MTLGRKLISIVSALVMLLSVVAYTTPIQAAQTCSIAILPVTVEDNTTIIKGHSFKLYQVATIENGEYKLTNDFKDLNAELDLNAANDLASDVTEFVEKNHPTGTTRSADTSGVIAFNNLTTGLYYIAQSNKVPGYDQVVPFMVALPYKSPDGTGYTYDIKAYPKVEPEKNTTPDDSDTPNTPDNPSQPTDPSNPNQPGDNNTQGDSNTPAGGGTTGGGGNTGNTGGSSTGNGTSSGGSSNVSGTTGNTASTGGGESTGTDAGSPVTNVVETVQETLAQTGALMWPILILTGFGLLLIIVGVYSVKKQKKQDVKGDA